MSARQSLTRTFFRGLVVVLPVAILVATVVWLGRITESFLYNIFQPFLPTAHYMPGMGLILGILLCLAVGAFMNTTLGNQVVEAWHRVLDRIPLIKSLYGAVEDILGSFSQDRKQRFNRVVKVRLPPSNMWTVGFVTREDLSELPDGLNNPGEIAVYLPMSYQIGGYLIFVPKADVEPLNLSVEDASRLILTAGMSIHKSS